MKPTFFRPVAAVDRAHTPASSTSSTPAGKRKSTYRRRGALPTRRPERKTASGKLPGPGQRAGLIAAIWIVYYLAFSVPVVIAGVATAHFGTGARPGHPKSFNVQAAGQRTMKVAAAQ
jgi:hypothetical protein